VLEGASSYYDANLVSLALSPRFGNIMGSGRPSAVQDCPDASSPVFRDVIGELPFASWYLEEYEQALEAGIIVTC
jgi:hypothetical protein